MAGERGDVEPFEGPSKTGWLATKQQAWDTAPGTPPRGPAAPTTRGYYGDKKFSLLFTAAVLAGLAAFGGFVVYSEMTTEFHHTEESPTTGEGFGNVPEPAGVGD